MDEDSARHTRALQTSLAKEALLIQQLRRLKNQIVETSTQLRAALSQQAVDATTIKELRTQAEKATAEAKLYRAKEQHVQALCQRLSHQVSDLQEQIRREIDDETHTVVRREEPPKKRAEARPRTVPFGHRLSSLDARTMALLDQQPSRALAKLTPFQRWKTEHHIVTPDTPTASDAFVASTKEAKHTALAASTPHRDPYGQTLRPR